jgi:hypothetical protein
MPVTIAEQSFDDKEGARFVFSGASEQEIADRVKRYLESQRYRRESGTDTEAVWGHGSPVLHALIGAFAGRAKFDLVVDGDAGRVVVTLKRGMSGVMGGAVGIARLKKKLRGLSDGLGAAVAD